jgi:hypothetical protein
VALCGVTAAGLGGLTLYYVYSAGLPEIPQVEQYWPPIVTEVYTDDAVLAGEFYNERRKVVPYDHIPKRLVQAFIASEDSSFFDHGGVDFLGTARAAYKTLMRKATGWVQPYFSVESFRVIVSEADEVRHDTEAIVKMTVGGERILRIGEGNGPVHALDAAVRSAIGERFPQLEKVHLTDFKVRVLDTNRGTGAVTRVLIDSTNGERTWSTIGVSENVIIASWKALEDSLVYALLHTEG